MRVAILQNWPENNVERQLPADRRGFEDIQFQFGDATGAEFVIVLNGVSTETWIEADPRRVWALVMEPPSAIHRFIHRGQPAFGRIYTSDVTLRGPRYRHEMGHLPWHILKTYDELAVAPYPPKTGTLSWVTSNLSWLPGHRKRLRFLELLQRQQMGLALFGRGFTPVKDKWEALAPYKYSIAFENYAGGYYITEKLVDCFLSFTMPFYYGSSEAERYFPAGSFIRIDPDDPQVFERMRRAIAENLHQENMQALLEARELCLNRYSTLAFIAREVRGYAAPAVPRSLRLYPLREAVPPLSDRLASRARRMLSTAFKRTARR